MSPRLRRLLPPVGLVLLALIPIWRAVMLGEAIGPVAQLFGPDDGKPWNVLQMDALLQFRVWRGLVFESWSHGQIPFWNPYSLLGTPLLANSQSGGLYPFHILMGVLRVPLDRAIGLLAWGHLALAALGTYRLCRTLGCDRASAFFGGSAFGLSAFLLAWTPLASVPTTVAWIPWLLFWIAAGRAGARRAGGWMALCFAMMLLAGHLQFAFYGGLGAGLFAVVYGGRSSLTVALPALLIGAMIASPQVGAALAFGQRSHRRAPATDEGYAAYSRSALQVWQLATVPSPSAQGLPYDGIEVGSQKLTGYWPSLVKPGENFAEAAVGLGAPVFLLLFLAPWRRREVWSVGLVAALGLLLAMPTLVNRLVYFGVPGWSATGSPGRAGVLFVLGGCVLGAMGFGRLRTLTPPDRRMFPVIGGFVAGLVLLAGLGSLAPANVLGIPSEAFGAIKMLNVLSGGVPLVLTFVALFLFFAVKRKERIVLFAAGLPVLVAFLGYGSGLIPTGVVPKTTISENVARWRVAVANDRWSLFVNPKAYYPPNTLALRHVISTGGYDSLIDRDTKALLDAANGRDSSPPENGNMMFVRSDADRGKLAELGVAVFLPSDKDATENAGVAGELASVDGGYARVIDVNESGFTLESDRTGTATVRFRNLPGWYRDGKRVSGDGVWITAPVEGEKPVRFSFESPGFLLPPFFFGLASLGILFASDTMRNGSGRRQNSTSDDAEPSPDAQPDPHERPSADA